jgi:phosphoglycolate phosphatase
MPPPSPERPAIRGAFFDLDGTLVDHFTTLFRCYEHALRSLGLPVPACEDVRRSVGGSMAVTMRRYAPPERIDEAMRLWREHFDRIYLEDVRLLPGAHDLLARLHARGLRLAVLTNKPGEPSRGICRHLGLEPWLAFVLGAGDTPWRKPQREFTEAALARLGVAAAETVIVGDSPFDIEGAHVSGLRAPCVATGTHTRTELESAGADGVFAGLAELGAAVFGLGPRNEP